MEEFDRSSGRGWCRDELNTTLSEQLQHHSEHLDHEHSERDGLEESGFVPPDVELGVSGPGVIAGERTEVSHGGNEELV